MVALLISLVACADPRGTVIIDRTCCGAIVSQRGESVYVISCGHHFKPSKTKRRPVLVTIPRDGGDSEYVGRLLCYRWEGDVCDGSLILFTSKDQQVCYKLASDKHRVEAGTSLTAFGRSGGASITERKTVLFDRDWNAGCDELTTTKGVAIAGDSGGPLLNGKGELLGIVSRSDRSYKTYWSSWRQLRKWLTSEGYGWVVK